MRYSRQRLRESVCAVTESSSASLGSTSGASSTSASRNFLIDFSSFAQTAFTQRLNAMMKTVVRITLAKLAKVKRELYQDHRWFIGINDLCRLIHWICR